MKRVYTTLFLLTLFLGIVSVYGDIYVPDNYSTIQEAIDAANPGDVIVVRDGIYYENLVINKSITLRSENGPENCIIDGNNSGDVIIIDADGVTIEGFTIRNSSIGDAGIKIRSNNNIIKNNNILNTWRGISLDESSNNIIINNNISKNYYSIDLDKSNNNTIINNNILNNHYGIDIYESSNNIITNNNISKNSDDSIHLYNSNNNSITDNNIYNNENGIIFYDSNNNIIIGNNLSNNNQFGISLYYSNSIINNNTFINNSIFIKGWKLEHWIHTIENNAVNGKPLYYFKNLKGDSVPKDAGQVILVNCSNVVVEDLDISNTDVGIAIAYSSNIAVKNCVISNNDYGIYLYRSSNSIINNNTFINNSIFIKGWKLEHWIHTIENNAVNGKPLYYFKNLKGDSVPKDAGQVILVNCSNVVVKDLDISNTDVGIAIAYSSNIAVKNCVISNNDYGIRLKNSYNNIITYNGISNNKNSIQFRFSNNNSITNNGISNNDYGIELTDSHNNTIISNNISNNKIGIYLDCSNSNNTIINNNIFNNENGIDLWYSRDNNIANNNISNNKENGIELDRSDNNTIFSNYISNNENGIRLYESKINIIINNNISNNWDGIYLRYSNNNSITNNYISNNGSSILLYKSVNNIITYNYISNNKGCGICLESSNDNKIYLNNFINNICKIHSHNSTNLWHTPDKITYTYNGVEHTNYLGNYWDDYIGKDTDEDGIGNTPYIIDSNNIDNYPLIQPWENYVTSIPIPAPISVPDIDINPATIDFGDTLVNETKTVIITITNRGNADLIITNISPKYPAPPAEIGLKNIPKLPLILKLGESYNLTVFFSPSKEGEYFNSVIIKSNDPDEPMVSIPLIGKAIDAPNLKVKYINVKTPVYNGIKTEVKVSIINDGTKNINTSFLVNITIKNSSQEVVYNITRNITELNKGTSEIITFNWTPEKPDIYNITVTVDPENDISEIYENDNNKTLTIEVKPIPVYIRLSKLSQTNNTIKSAIEVSNIPEERPLRWYNISIKLENLTVINITPIVGTCDNLTSNNVLYITGNISSNESGRFSIVNITFNISGNYSAIMYRAELLDTNSISFHKVILESEVIGTIKNIIIDKDVKNYTKIKRIIKVGDMNLTELQIINETNPSNLNDTLIIPILNESMKINFSESVIENITKTLEVAESIKKKVIRNESDVEKVVEKIAENITPVLALNFNITPLSNKTEVVNSTAISTISFKAENTSKKGFTIVRIPIGNLTVENITVSNGTTTVALIKDDIGSEIGWYRIPTDGILEITLIKDPEVNITLSTKLPEGTTTTEPTPDDTDDGGSGGGGGSSHYTSDGAGSSLITEVVAEDIKSEKIKRFVYKTKLIVGSEIDINLSAKYLKTDVNITDRSLEIKEDCILIGGPVANPVVKKYLNYFPVRVTNEYPGKHRGVIEVIKIDGHTVVLLAGSDRWGTKAAVEYFKTLEDLPDEPIFVEWRNGKAVRIERP